MSAHAWALCGVVLAACGGMVEAAPEAVPVPVDTTAYYLDATCAARPAAVSRGSAEEIVEDFPELTADDVRACVEFGKVAP